MADRTMTYKEAASEFGLSTEAVRKRAVRLRWRITQGNDGKARVIVPDGEALRPPVRPAGQPAGDREDGRVEAAEARVRKLEAELAGERTARQAAEADAANRREQAAMAQGEVKATQEALAHERTKREAAEAELAGWTAGGPLARLVRGLFHRRGRA